MSMSKKTETNKLLSETLHTPEPLYNSIAGIQNKYHDS